MMKSLSCVAALMVASTPAVAKDTSLEGLQERIVGTWTSMACELRPTANPDGGQF